MVERRYIILPSRHSEMVEIYVATKKGDRRLKNGGFVAGLHHSKVANLMSYTPGRYTNATSHEIPGTIPISQLKKGKAVGKKKTSKKAPKVERVCLSSGYAYELERGSHKRQLDPGVKRWKNCSDSAWDIVMVDAVPGVYLGERSIDGARVSVVKVGGKIYAQTALNVRKC